MSEQISTIHAAIEFIEKHLQDEISVGDIAASAGYSLYHFIRTFNQTVHHSPYDYLMRRRLSEAARELLANDRRIIDISLDFCFHSHETFARAFKRMFTMQPSQWRSQKNIPHKSFLSNLTMEYLTHINQKDFLPPDLVDRDETILAGIMTQGRENLPLLWQSLERRLGLLSLPEGARDFYRVSTQAQIPEEMAFFLCAVKVETSEKIPPTLVSQTIPAGLYARFIHKGTDATLHLTD
jgi:AraC family transcriptional regulator